MSAPTERWGLFSFLGEQPHQKEEQNDLLPDEDHKQMVVKLLQCHASSPA